jgi:broad specificity phosphatase PhoE
VNGMVPVHVVRHGATRMNNQTDLSQDRIRGWSNVPLADDGREDARKAAEALRRYGIEIIVSSDLIRAAETANIISGIIGAPVILNHKLRPWNLGDFTGANTKDSLPKIAVFAQETPDQPIPGGESFNSFKERAFQGLAEAIQAAQGRQVAVVTHHRDERLWRAWEAAGEPATHEIDLGTFLQKGDPPGGVFVMDVNTSALAPQGGQPGMDGVGPPPGAPPMLPPLQQPPGAPGQLPALQGAQPQADPLAPVLAKLQTIVKAIDMLRSDIPRGYRIDIEVDTMVAGDHQQERQDATEFISEVTKFIQVAGQISAANTDFAPLAAKMLQFGVRKFRTGRDLESAIDEYADKVSKQMAHPAAAGKKSPTPEQTKAQAEQTRAQAEIAKAQMDAKSAQANDQRQAQLEQMRFQMEQMKFKMEMAKMQRQEEYDLLDHQMRMQEHQQRMAAAAARPPVGVVQ